MEDNQRYMLDLIDGAHARTVKWMGRIIIALIACWLITIVGFIWYLNQYDFTSESYWQDGVGVNIIGAGNGVNNSGAEILNENAGS